MRGTADPGTLTGQVQRALTDEWKTQARIVQSAGLHSVRSGTLRALLERLVREGRAEIRRTDSPHYMSGGFDEFRRAGGHDEG
jgi:hypothetical protein